MDDALVSRALSAASSVGRDAGLVVTEAVVLQNANNLAVRLLPCDTFARVALIGREVADFEVALAQHLKAVAAPIAPLEPRVIPQVYERDGLAITFWTHVATSSAAHSPDEYADALHRLHTALRKVDLAAPPFTDRIASAEHLIAHPDESPALSDDDRQFLLHSLRDSRTVILARGRPEQLLHGEPHPGNVLTTRRGPLFIDLETCCRGPVEFDLAHVPVEVAARHPDLDDVLLQECRRLVLALVAAWRWDARDEFPHGRAHGLRIIELLRAGQPWPVLGALAAS